MQNEELDNLYCSHNVKSDTVKTDDTGGSYRKYGTERKNVNATGSRKH